MRRNSKQNLLELRALKTRVKVKRVVQEENLLREMQLVSVKINSRIPVNKQLLYFSLRKKLVPVFPHNFLLIVIKTVDGFYLSLL
jgi:hypothetical protein